MADQSGKTRSDAPVFDWVRGTVGGAQLRPQSLAVFKLLHDCAGQVVSKDDIMSSVWPNVAVTDDSLVQCITEIRKALGDDAHSVVKTLPKRGYVYEAAADAVSPVAVEGKTQRWLVAAGLVFVAVILAAAFWPKPTPKPAELPAIAVLPFTNLGTDEKGNRFARMLTEDVITDLSHAKDFGVIARNSSEVYGGKAVDVREVGKALNVQYVLEGSVQTESGKVRATAQLIETRTGKHIWAERFERSGDDVFSVEEEIVQRIANSVGDYAGAVSRQERKLARLKPPTRWTAYEAYQRGLDAKHTLDPARFSEAANHFKQAIAQDPDFARAYVGLGFTYQRMIMAQQVDYQSTMKLWFDAIQKAIALDPNDGVAFVNLANYYSWTGEWEELKAAAKKALQLSPNDADVLVLAANSLSWAGDTELPVKLADRALSLNPNAPSWYPDVVIPVFFFAKDYARAFEQTKAVKPETGFQFLISSMVAAQAGQTRDATEYKRRLLAYTPDYSQEAYASAWLAAGDPAITALITEAHVKAGIPTCMRKEQAVAAASELHSAQCDAERAKEMG